MDTSEYNNECTLKRGFSDQLQNSGVYFMTKLIVNIDK